LTVKGAKDIPCGIYRTTRRIGDSVPAGVLVYYHNHGDPGPGVYLPQEWKNNVAIFEENGTTIPDDRYARSLEPLPAEGYYRVAEAFYCCEMKCQYFEEDLLVQLGYDGEAQPILFIPELVEGALALPEEGTVVEDWQLSALKPLKIPEYDDQEEQPEVEGEDAGMLN
jgi:hypothetical protein